MPFTFDMLEPGLALSGKPEGHVAPTEFEVILNVCDPEPPAYARGLPAHVRLIRHAFEDSLPVPRPFLRAAVFELADCRRRELSTLVHCHMGQSRSPTVVALYWMARDGISWDAALRRLQAARPQCQPHPLLADSRTRDSVAEGARRVIAGDTSILQAACSHAAALQAAHQCRGGDFAPRRLDWDWIENGLACGSSPRSVEELVERGFAGFLNLDVCASLPYAKSLPPTAQCTTLSIRDDKAVQPARLREAVAVLQRWRAEGRAVFVHCTDGKSRSALVLAAYLMIDRNWDFASALWYIRLRRKGACPMPQLNAGRALAELGI
jgi:protein-tyrosine phosphatase